MGLLSIAACDASEASGDNAKAEPKLDGGDFAATVRSLEGIAAYWRFDDARNS